MPAQGQAASNLGTFISAVQTQCLDLAARVDELTGPVSAPTDFTPGADIDMKEHEILNGGDASFQTVSYTALDPPVDASSSLLLGAVENQVNPIAPAGLRDSWTIATGVTANGGFLTYDPVRGIIWSTDWSSANKVNYSTDNGHTWASCVFDVPLAARYVLGFSPTTVVIVPNVAAPVYTSSDGINFTAGAITPGQRGSINVIWSASLGLFIAGININSSSWVATSPTGAVWTPRTTPNFTGLVNFTELGQSGDTGRLIMVGDSRTNPIYSDDGINWYDGRGSTAPTQAICWSNERKEFIAGGVTSHIIRSTDGETWTELTATNGPSSSVCIIYVGGEIQRYYASRVTPEINFTLWSTADPALPWQCGDVTGSQKIQQTYGGVVYLPTVNSFVIAIQTNVAAYSTPRLGDIVPLFGGNIRVRGSPVHVDVWSTNGSSVVNTSTETDISVGATTLGNLYITPIVPLGMTLTETLFMTVTSAAGDTLTIRHKLAGVTFMTNTLTIPGGASGLTIKIVTDAIFASSTVTSFSTVMQGTAISTATSSGAVTRTNGNLYSTTAKWTAALSTCNVLGMRLEATFRNG